MIECVCVSVRGILEAEGDDCDKHSSVTWMGCPLQMAFEIRHLPVGKEGAQSRDAGGRPWRTFTFDSLH